VPGPASTALSPPSPSQDAAGVLRGLRQSIAVMDAPARADSAALMRKIEGLMRQLPPARTRASLAEAAARTAEAQLRGWVDHKRELRDALAEATMGRLLRAASVPRTGSSLHVRHPVSGSPARGGGGAAADDADDAAPLRPPTPAEVRAGAEKVAILGRALARADDQIRVHTSAWRAAVWETTFRRTTVDELDAAVGALRSQLAAMLERVQREERAQARQAWRAMGAAPDAAGAARPSRAARAAAGGGGGGVDGGVGDDGRGAASWALGV
jgi:hypothetical protein